MGAPPRRPAAGRPLDPVDGRMRGRVQAVIYEAGLMQIEAELIKK
jgi:hypothetical protein